MKPLTTQTGTAPHWQVRPITPADAPAFTALHGQTQPAEVLALIARSQQAFATPAAQPGLHLFVLSQGARMLAAMAVNRAAGLDLPRYHFRTGQVVHASAEMGIFNRADTLLLGNDLTGAAELRLPLVSPAAPQGSVDLLLQAALMWLSQQKLPARQRLICELTGRHSSASPFWQGLGAHFHGDTPPPDDAFFSPAARSHIGRLLPKHPLYSSFLPTTAQAVMGQHDEALNDWALLLQAHGLRARGQLSVFDGGPVFEAGLDELRTLKAQQSVTLQAIDVEATDPCWLLSLGEAEDFRAGVVQGRLDAPGRLSVDAKALEALDATSASSALALPWPALQA